MSLRQIGGIAGRALDRSPVFKIDEASTQVALTADIARMKELLVEPTCDFEAGLVSLIAASGETQ